MSTEEFHWSVNVPFIEDVSYRTLVTQYESGKEQRRQKWSSPKRMYSAISLRGRTDTIVDQVWDFYNAREGSYDTFYFKNPNENPVTNETFGIGDGTTTDFNLANYPLPSGAISMTVAGVAQTETTDYTLTRSTGAVSFVAAPGAGEACIATSYNFSRIVRFSEDKMSREMFNYKLYNAELKFIEVLS